MAEDLRLPVGDAVRLAQHLLDEGRPFHAHEVFEGLWKSAESPAQRALWQGLAQLAVGLTHEARGNTRGAESLVRRGRDRLAALSADGIDAVDLPRVLAWADGWLAGGRASPLRLG